MSALERFERAAHMKPLEQLSREQIAARIDRLQQSLEDLALQSHLDGGPAFACVGRMKVVLADYRERLRQMAGSEFAQLLAGEHPVQQVPMMPAVASTGSYAPTARQVAYYRRLIESPVFTPEERTRALEWLERYATKQLIKNQISWLVRQVETRRPAEGR